jgi:membrane-bound lytic murein transglycosylase D
MKKKKMLFLIMLCFVWTCTIQAQVNLGNANAEHDEEEETEEIEEISEDEITVTDSEGNEELIEFPEAMTYDLDSLLNLYMSKTYLGKPGDCEMKNENPTFDREVYIERLRRIPSVMELAYNDIVQRFIDRYSGRLRYSVSYMLGAANFYMPIFEEALDTYQLPLELKYLPIIESALNPKAVSRVGATGLWQFMLSTGKQYGLEINSLVDERRDPVKSSYAAARMLRDLYRIFGDWNLVIAAYNCGPENIKKAIHRANGEKDYWKIYPYLPAETRGYVPAFIAANYIMTYYCEHNICPMTTYLPAQSDTVVVNKELHLEQIAGVIGTDIDLLRSLNPEFRRDIVPGNSKPYAIRMPISDTGKFIDNQDSIFNYRTTELLTKRAIVDVNDDLPTYTRSKRGGYSSKRGRYNKRHNARGGGRRSRGGSGSSVTIRKGQTLSEIAKRNGTTVAKLKKLNGIKGSNIRAGKKIRVK